MLDLPQAENGDQPAAMVGQMGGADHEAQEMQGLAEEVGAGHETDADAAIAQSAGVAELKMILGAELSDTQVVNLLRLSRGDINMAVQIYFDDSGVVDDVGNQGQDGDGIQYEAALDADAPAPANSTGAGGADDVFANLAALSVHDSTQDGAAVAAGPRTPRGLPTQRPPVLSADRGPGVDVDADAAEFRVGAPAPGSEPRDAAEDGNGVNGHGVQRPRSRRPATAPPSRQAAQADEEFAVKAEAMRSVVGADVSDDVLRQLLRSTGGNVQLALDAFFDNDHGNGNGFVFVGSSDAAGAPQELEPPPPPEPARRGARRRQQRPQDDTPGPRKPFDDLALMLGTGVKASILGPIMVETQGDVPKALELYCERNADPNFREEAAQRDASVSAEEYYLRPDKAVAVVCNVYDLAWGAEDKEGKKKKVNSGLPGMGFGIYHSGIEIYGREISFGYSDDGSTGVFEVPRRCAGGVMPRITFKEAHVMGEIMRSRYEVDHLLTKMAEKWPGDSYDLVRRNCNHFANELCVFLTGKKIPSYINRPATVGRYALNIFSVPAQAIGKLVDGVKKTTGPKAITRKQGSAVSETQDGEMVVAAPSAAAVVAASAARSDDEAGSQPDIPDPTQLSSPQEPRQLPASMRALANYPDNVPSSPPPNESSSSSQPPPQDPSSSAQPTLFHM